nr:PREDICTED: putative nuclease HARBI1 [Linepithema humile]
MSTPDSYRSVSTKFGVGKATAFRALRRVTYALHCIAPQFIQWPKNAVATKVMEEFEQACGFPKVIGANDGTHIKIRTLKEVPDSYVNRKGFHSMNIQVVCDSRGLFTHCYAGHMLRTVSIHMLWILLDCLPLTDVRKIPEFILACYILHNICILQNDIIELMGICTNEEEVRPILHDNAVELGNAKRIVIMNTLPRKI